MAVGRGYETRGTVKPVGLKETDEPVGKVEPMGPEEPKEPKE